MCNGRRGGEGELGEGGRGLSISKEKCGYMREGIGGRGLYHTKDTNTSCSPSCMHQKALYSLTIIYI